MANDPPLTDTLDYHAPSTISRIPFGEALFTVSQSSERATIAIRAPDALVRGVAAQYYDGEQPQPRTAMVMDFEAQTISIFPQLIYFSDRLYGYLYQRTLRCPQSILV